MSKSYVFIQSLISTATPKMTTATFRSAEDARVHVTTLLNSSVDVSKVEMYEIAASASKEIVINWS